jgi:hypothetical protein
MFWRSLLAALLVFGLALSGAILAGSAPRPGGGIDGQAPKTANAAAQKREKATQLPQLVGMSLNVYHAQSMGHYRKAIDRMAAMGLNTLQIVTPAFQKNGAAAKVDRIVGPGRGPSLGDLIALLQYAKDKGLRTILMPQVNFTDPRGNEWRGKIEPPDWAKWWQSYHELIDEYLKVARLGEVDVFTVGCELLSTLDTRHRAQWHRVIRRCRDRFNGQLTFSTTWDTYTRVDFWQALDYIGISGYWDLTTEAANPDNPSDEALAKRWRQIQERVFAFADEQDRPLLITEIGYPTLPWALKDPWNYVNSSNAEPDHQAQARGYRAFLRNWHGYVTPPGQKPTRLPTGDGPRVAGVVFYEWDVYADQPDQDTGLGIWGKPAYGVLRDWLDNGEEAVARGR